MSVQSAGGIAGRVLGGATAALLAAGALDDAAARIVRAAETARPAALAA